MNWNLSHSFKDVNGENLSNDWKLDYAMLEITDANTGSLINTYDIKSNKDLKMTAVKMGIYNCKITIHSDSCDTNNNTKDIYGIDVRPDANEVFTSSHEVIKEDDGDIKLSISWEIYHKNAKNFRIYILKEKSGKYVAYSTVTRTDYGNVILSDLPIGNYKYYFTFESPDCIFPDNKRLRLTSFDIS